MRFNTVIFDMDGLLIDSEPYWQEAGMETLQQFDAALTLEQYHLTTGLRTKEWIEFWFSQFKIDMRFAKEAERTIIHKAIEKIKAQGQAMPGVEYILPFFREREFTIGLATSSPNSLIEVVVEKLGVGDFFDIYSSAETLPYSKPHPRVYLQCAEQLQISPLQCICFEDSFHGMISVKAARMKCVIIPASDLYAQPKWGAADLKLASLKDFNEESLGFLMR
ncbi:MAG TPA: hexitol phosphatase HxpB [Puia sp.]|nr:hexitol phosphatase HxpB [Puia sp.]